MSRKITAPNELLIGLSEKTVALTMASHNFCFVGSAQAKSYLETRLLMEMGFEKRIIKCSSIYKRHLKTIISFRIISHFEDIGKLPEIQI
jgi:hypothetical protein